MRRQSAQTKTTTSNNLLIVVTQVAKILVISGQQALTSSLSYRVTIYRFEVNHYNLEVKCKVLRDRG